MKTSTAKQNSSPGSVSRNLLNAFSCLVLAGGAFVLLTNAIPLIQWGWLPEFGSKTRYANVLIIYAASLFTAGFLWRWRFPDSFKNLWVVSFFRTLSERGAIFLAVGLTLCYFASAVLIGFERHAAMETRAFDLGIFAQAIWTTLHGDFLFSSIKGNVNLLTDHMNLFLVALVPFYSLWPDPRMLLILQAAASSLLLMMVFYAAKHLIQNRKIALIFAFLFFLYSPSHSALHEDFHPETVVEPLLLVAFYALIQRRTFLFVFLSVIVMTAKENMTGIIFMLGFYAFCFQRQRALGAVMMALSFGFLIGYTRFLVPWLGTEQYFYQGNFKEILSAPGELVLRRIIRGETLSYVLKLFLPLGFLSFFHFPSLLLTAPVLAQNILSSNPTHLSFNYHYTVGLTPFIFISAIYGWKTLQTRFVWFMRYRAWIAMLIILLSIIRTGPSEYFFHWQSHKHRSAHKDMMRSELAKIPAEASVLTHNNLIAQIPNRKYVHQFDYNTEPSKQKMAADLSPDYVILAEEFWEPGTPDVQVSLAALLELGYQTDKQDNGFYILSRRRVA